MSAYLSEEFERHRVEEPDDLLTDMLHLPQDVHMSDAEIRSAISVLLLAGYAALQADQFFLLYQPTFDLSTGAFTSVEALLRWRHPTRG